MSDLSQYSPDQLRRELESRERKAAIPPPTPLEQPNWDVVLRTVTDGVAYAVRDGYIDKNLKGYIFEAALEAVYGHDVWAWWNVQRQPS